MISTAAAATPGAVWVTLDRAERRNAFDWEMLERFHATLDELEERRDVAIVLIRSALERVWVAGGDIAVMRDLSVVDGSRFVYAGHRLMRRLEESRLVFVAAVGGFALGGGTELALACDIILATESATFGLPEANIGLFPGWGGTQRLARAIGPWRARELVYTGRRVPAPEAFQLGFVNRVVPDDGLEAAGEELAAAIRKSSPTAVVQAKRAITQGVRASLDQGLVIEAEAWLANLASPNRVEGLSAFLEKREPRFVDE